MAKDTDYYLGIDLGGTNIQCALVADEKIVQRDSTKTKSKDGADAVIDRISKLASEVIEKASVKRSDVVGAGIGAPGAMDPKKGIVMKAVNLGWNDYPLAKELSKAMDMPITIDNDVNVGAWGEFSAGAGKKYDDLFAIFVGTGVGGGLVLNKELYHGPMFTAGEIGHNLLLADGARGRRTVEDLASRGNMVRKLVQLIESGHDSIVPELVDGDLSKVRSKVLAQAVKQEDPLALEVVQHAAHYIGVAIANVVTLLSLPCVVVGGGATEALGKTWMNWVRESFEEYVFPHEMRKCELVASILEDDAGPLGAALLAQSRLSKQG